MRRRSRILIWSLANTKSSECQARGTPRPPSSRTSLSLSKTTAKCRQRPFLISRLPSSKDHQQVKKVARGKANRMLGALMTSTMS